MKEENFNLKKQVKELENKVDYLENQSRRNNLVIYGLQEDNAESWQDTENKARAFVSDFFKITLEERDVERAHRLDAKRDGATSNLPVILKFINHKIKEKIIKNCKKLKGTRFSIADDFSAKVRDECRQLKPFSEQAKKDGHNATLRFNKIVINNKSMSIHEIQKGQQNGERSAANIEVINDTYDENVKQKPSRKLRNGKELVY